MMKVSKMCVYNKMTKYTTLADLYLEKLGVTCMKSYPPIPATVFLSKEQLAIWTELNTLDKNIQINASLEELENLPIVVHLQQMV